MFTFFVFFRINGELSYNRIVPVPEVFFMNFEKDNWLSSNTTFFWGEIAPTSHVLQLYESDEAFLNLLEGFVVEGIKGADAVIVICTEDHLKSLDARLIECGLDMKTLQEDNQYIPVNADVTLSGFMINGKPDLHRFEKMIKGLMNRAQKNGRKIRAFGEMVAILWEQGNIEATMTLEHLWNDYLKKDSFCLYCAYPANGFTQKSYKFLTDICCSHALMVRAGSSKSQINYLSTESPVVQ